MFTVQNAAIGVSLLLFAWYFAGLYINRRRSTVLIHHLREALQGTGRRLTIRWYGRSAFRIDVVEPKAPLLGLQALCMLEPRDFALALAWNRLRGRRDQIILSAGLSTPPPTLVPLPAPSYGIPGLTRLEVLPAEPQLRLTLQVRAGSEDSIRQAVDLVREFPLKKQA